MLDGQMIFYTRKKLVGQAVLVKEPEKTIHRLIFIATYPVQIAGMKEAGSHKFVFFLKVVDLIDRQQDFSAASHK
mgnify:FL=1